MNTEVTENTEVNTQTNATPQVVDDPRPYMQQFIERLFENGVEGWNREEKKILNAGGAKAWLKIRHLDPGSSGIAFHDDSLREALSKGMRASCFTFDRIELDEDGDVVYQQVNDVPTQYPNRICQSIGFYSSTDENPVSGKLLKNHILAACPGLEGYVATLDEYSEFLTSVGAAVVQNGRLVMPAIQVRDMQLGTNHSARLSNMVILAISSGSKDGSAMWGFVQTNKTKAEAAGALSPETATPPV